MRFLRWLGGPHGVTCKVHVVAQENIVLAGLAPIDGVEIEPETLVLAAGQDRPAENGVYVTCEGLWSRVSDLAVRVEQGTRWAGSLWVRKADR